MHISGNLFYNRVHIVVEMSLATGTTGANLINVVIIYTGCLLI